MFLTLALLAASPPIADGQRIQARLVRVVDGDTLRIDLDIGADVILKNQAVRILGIDAPEMREIAGRRSKAAMEAFLIDKKLEIELHGKDKYGRWLGDVYADGENVALWMLRNGHAKLYSIGRQGMP